MRHGEGPADCDCPPLEDVPGKDIEELKQGLIQTESSRSFHKFERSAVG